MLFFGFPSILFRLLYSSPLFLLSGGSLACDDVDMLEIPPVATLPLLPLAAILLNHYNSTDTSTTTATTVTTTNTTTIHCHVQVPFSRCLRTN